MPAEATTHDGFPALPAREVSSRTPAPPAEDASSETPRGSPVDGGLHRERQDEPSRGRTVQVSEMI